jgi:uncharacterized protein (TIGR03083 family)
VTVPHGTGVGTLDRMPPRARKYDPVKVRAAVKAQVEAVGKAAHAVPADRLADPSGLPGWDVHQLLVHIARQIEAVPRLVGEAPPAAAQAEVDLSLWARSTAAIADRLDEDTREAAAATEDAAARIDTAAARLDEVLEEAGSTRLVPHLFGAMTAADFLVTRLVELVVHSDDLATATGMDVPLDRQALAAVTRLLADALAAKAPGGSVELRVPPFAVVQCVPGPKHTRGTPPNVVETDPLTWIRLATGRVPWAAATADARITASGDRSDLSGLLPVLG